MSDRVWTVPRCLALLRIKIPLPPPTHFPYQLDFDFHWKKSRHLRMHFNFHFPCHAVMNFEFFIVLLKDQTIALHNVVPFHKMNTWLQEVNGK
jgi:hypothetical protein